MNQEDIDQLRDISNECWEILKEMDKKKKEFEKLLRDIRKEAENE